MADDQATRAAGEAAIGDQTDLLAQSLAGKGGRHAEHFAHARAADRSLAPDDDDVAGLNLPGADGGETGFFAVEYFGRPGQLPFLEAGYLRYGAIGRQVPFQNDDVSMSVHRRVDRLDDR